MEDMTVGDIISATGGSLVNGNLKTEVPSISTDTRTIKAGEFFLALRGKNFDGHDFLSHAIKAGASGVIYEKGKGGLLRGIEREREISEIVVKETTEALFQIASYYRAKFSIQVIGVTGSNGKTTTKDMIATVLSKRYKVLKNEASFNNEIGVPLTLFNLARHHEVAVLELGMSAFGEIRKLATLIRPCYGVITNVGEAHIEFLGTRENIARAKGELLDVLGVRDTAILNADDPLVMELGKRFNGKIKTFGLTAKDCDYRGTNISEQAPTGITFSVALEGKKRCEFFIPILGIYNVYNALAAIALGHIFGMDLTEIKDAIQGFKPPPMRGEVMDLEGVTIINDSYNCNPTAMKEALGVLNRLKCKGKKGVVMGDMLELGERSIKEHEKIGALIGECFDFLLTYGPLSTSATKKVRRDFPTKHIYSFQNKKELVNKLKDILRPGDAFLLKGSRKMKMEEVIELLRGEG